LASDIAAQMEDGPNHLRLSIQQDPQAAEVMRELGDRMHTRISESTLTHPHPVAMEALDRTRFLPVDNADDSQILRRQRAPVAGSGYGYRIVAW
jgi:hypothetical protein